MSLINCKVVKTGASYEEYHRQDAKRGQSEYSMSRSELVEFYECPAKWILGPHGDDSTPSMDFGSLVDCLVTQPERFDDLFAVCPETYTNKKGETKGRPNARTASRQTLRIKMPISQSDYLAMKEII